MQGLAFSHRLVTSATHRLSPVPVIGISTRTSSSSLSCVSKLNCVPRIKCCSKKNQSFGKSNFSTTDAKKFEEASKNGNLVPRYKCLFSDQLTPVLAYRCLVKEDDREAPSFLCKSVEQSTRGRYSVVGAQPAMEIIAKENKVRYVEKKRLPFSKAPEDDKNLPDMHLGLYDDVIVFDLVEKKWKGDIEQNLAILDFDHVLREDPPVEPATNASKEVKDKYLQWHKHSKMALITMSFLASDNTHQATQTKLIKRQKSNLSGLLTSIAALLATLFFSLTQVQNSKGCAKMMSRIGESVSGGNWKYAHGTAHYGLNGVKFLTEQRDQRRKTQNNDIMVVGKDNVAYYGIVVAVIKLLYPAAKQVFYLDDPKAGGGWKVVNVMEHRSIFNATTLQGGRVEQNIENVDFEPYQEPLTSDIPDTSTIRINNNIHFPQGEYIPISGLGFDFDSLPFIPPSLDFINDEDEDENEIPEDDLEDPDYDEDSD
ncbi:hypothetical protein ACLB2K_031013 [Fragaria x ananassa]